MTDQTWIFLGLVVTAFVPLLLKWQENRARRQERMEDHERQDAIAAKVEEAAKEAKAAGAAVAEVKGAVAEIHATTNSLAAQARILAEAKGAAEGELKGRADAKAEIKEEAKGQ